MNLLFSWSGRIGRGKFWLGQLLIVVIGVIISGLYYAGDPSMLERSFAPPPGQPDVPLAAIVTGMLIGAVFAIMFLLGHPLLTFLISVAGAVVMLFFSDQYYDFLISAAPEQADAINASRITGPMMIIGPILSLLTAWAIMAIAIKRVHDRGQSGWWLLLTLIPGVGFIWWLVNLGLLEGEEGLNRHGPSPRRS